MKGTFIYTGLFLSFMLLCQWEARAQVVITQVTTWRSNIDEAQFSIPDEAGSDINGTIESAANYNQLDILNLANTQGWKVTVSKQDINWPASFIPYLQRTSNGMPCGTCSGINSLSSYTGYMQITNMEQDFIFGSGEVSDIDIQFRIEGLSLAVDAQNYTTEIIFTLYGE